MYAFLVSHAFAVCRVHLILHLTTLTKYVHSANREDSHYVIPRSVFRACKETTNVVLWDAYLYPKLLLPRKYVFFFCFWRDNPPVGQGLLIHEVSRSHNDTLHSVGILWTSDQLVAETSN